MGFLIFQNQVLIGDDMEQEIVANLLEVIIGLKKSVLPHY